VKLQSTSQGWQRKFHMSWSKLLRIRMHQYLNVILAITREQKVIFLQDKGHCSRSKNLMMRRVVRGLWERATAYTLWLFSAWSSRLRFVTRWAWQSQIISISAASCSSSRCLLSIWSTILELKRFQQKRKRDHRQPICFWESLRATSFIWETIQMW
jgi:hypothetical protein